MNCLAIDTSGTHLTVALITDEKVTTKYMADSSLRHSVVLMDAVESVLNEGGVKLMDIDVFACALGPGSFTGIRIGVATAKALAYANNKKVLGVTSFEVLAYNKQYGKTLACIDARHGNHYACGFDGEKVILPPCFLSDEAIVKLAQEYEILSSSTTQIYAENASLVDGFINAVKCKINGATYDVETLVPLYVRKSQAEENL